MISNNNSIHADDHKHQPQRRPVALIFPGQGAQYVGMNKKFLHTPYMSLFQKADVALGYSLSELCEQGPDTELALTFNTQPAILTQSIALYSQLLDAVPELSLDNCGNKQSSLFDVTTLGHSVGEYGALVACGSLSFEDAVKLVHLRGKYMQEAVPVGVGGMYAVLKVDSEAIKTICAEQSNDQEQVAPANYNEPAQTVISGNLVACERAVAKLKEVFPQCRAIKLNVSAPFHSQLMKPAAERLKVALEVVQFSSNKTAYIANINAAIYEAGTPARTIVNNLIDQVCGHVLWTKSIQQLPENTLCIEVGPGNVLKGLVKKIRPELLVLTTDNDNAFETIKSNLYSSMSVSMCK